MKAEKYALSGACVAMDSLSDVFVEQIVKKRFGPKDYAVTVFTVLAGLAVVALSFLVPALGVLILVLAVAGVYYVVSSRKLEFEYSVTNGDITIDKIINRRRRKGVIRTDAQYIEEIGKYDPRRLENRRGYAKIFVSEYDDGRGGWYFCAHDPKRGNVFVIFNPNERVLRSIKTFLPRQVAFHAFGRD